MKTLREINDEREDEFIPDELFTFNELDKEGKKQAINYFCKYNLLYLDRWGVPQEATPEDISNRHTLRYIIKAMKGEDIRFYEDGSHF